MNFPLSHGSDADFDEFRNQVNEFLIRSNGLLKKERDSFLRAVRADEAVVHVDTIKKYFVSEKIRTQLSAMVRADTVLFDSGNMVPDQCGKRQFMCERIFKLKPQYEPHLKQVHVYTVNDLFIFLF